MLPILYRHVWYFEASTAFYKSLNPIFPLTCKFSYLIVMIVNIRVQRARLWVTPERGHFIKTV